MITETELYHPVSKEILQEDKMEQFRRAVVFDLALDEYLEALNEQEYPFPEDFINNVKLVTKLIRFSVFNAYRDVLKYGTFREGMHANAVIQLVNRYHGGMVNAVVVGGGAHHAVEQISILVQTFGSWDYQNKFVPR